MSRAAPSISISHLDQLWFQVAGTLCNLKCGHCFISCSPKNDTFGFLSLETVRRCLTESVALGVKEYYFTGGEPFLHPDMTQILVETLHYGPATVLTNGTRFRDESLAALARAADESRYSLEFRVSIDGYSPATNDPIRGAGTFERAMRGVAKLVRHDFLPIVTIARTWSDDEEALVIGKFCEALAAVGCDRPRLKVLPTLRIGAEARRTRGYDESERVDTEMMIGYDTSQLICEHSRIVTNRGVYVCPILIDSPEARLGETLAEALVPYPIEHGACFTCYQYGAICANPGGGGEG
jgi:sulfatase maturation enzyme AslB (radical SAM superfamily)